MTTKFETAVTEFHSKHQFPIGILPGENPSNDSVRLHLIAEELSELALGIAERNLVDIADAIADLVYVVVGTAVTYGIPVEPVFMEIHKSNMTKAARSLDDTRVRQKGDSYIPPNVRKVLEDNGIKIEKC